MALDATFFKTIVAGVNQIHHYQSADAIAAVTGANYFNGVSGRCKKGDIIMVYDNNLNTVDMLVVTSETHAPTVTVVNGT